MDPISTLIVSKALDGLSMRYLATADNIANANSRGFRPTRVSFEEALRAAAGGGPDAIRQVQPRAMRVDGAANADPRLDMELATAAETSLRYSALLNLLGRQIQISRAAVRGGQ